MKKTSFLLNLLVCGGVVCMQTDETQENLLKDDSHGELNSLVEQTQQTLAENERLKLQLAMQMEKEKSSGLCARFWNFLFGCCSGLADVNGDGKVDAKDLIAAGQQVTSTGLTIATIVDADGKAAKDWKKAGQITEVFSASSRK
ncbi:MAG: hypothetical protein LBS23_02935 [Holosporaceae bacterium]|nr:hypothetical protein [Holosporaceae bacterium]